MCFFIALGRYSKRTVATYRVVTGGMPCELLISLSKVTIASPVRPGLVVPDMRTDTSVMSCSCVAPSLVCMAELPANFALYGENTSCVDMRATWS